MLSSSVRRASHIVALAFLAAACSASGVPKAGTSNKYEDLTALFAQWREFQKPVVVDGIPDYSAAAMAEIGRAHV